MKSNDHMCAMQEIHKGFTLLTDCRDECWITWLEFSNQAWTPGTLGAGRIVNYVCLNIMNTCELWWVEPSPTKSLWSSSSFLGFPGGESARSFMWGATLPCFTEKGSTHLTAVVNLPSEQFRSATFSMMTCKVLWTASRIGDCEVSEPLLSTRH